MQLFSLLLTLVPSKLLKVALGWLSRCYFFCYLTLPHSTAEILPSKSISKSLFSKILYTTLPAICVRLYKGGGRAHIAWMLKFPVPSLASQAQRSSSYMAGKASTGDPGAPSMQCQVGQDVAAVWVRTKHLQLRVPGFVECERVKRMVWMCLSEKSSMSLPT